jgi:hypothetical protein
MTMAMRHAYETMVVGSSAVPSPYNDVSGG